MLGTFADAVKEALREQGWSLRAAARAMNYDPAFLSRVLSGKQPPSPQLVRSLDRLLGAGDRLTALANAANGEDIARVVRALDGSRIDGGAVKTLADVLWAQRQLEDALGASAVLPAMRGQLRAIRELTRNARGPHRGEFMAIAAEWLQFTGWLHASVRKDEQAIDLFSRAEELADEADAPTVAAIATSFKAT